MKKMRREDRAISQEDAMILLVKGEYGVLSTVSDKNEPYGVPLNYLVSENSIYFHSAVEGEKIVHVENNNRVSFCVVGRTKVIPSKFSTAYESAIVFGEIAEVYDDEKQNALEGLVNKYSPDFEEKGKEYIEGLSVETRAFKINIEHLSGKVRKF